MRLFLIDYFLKAACTKEQMSLLVLLCAQLNDMRVRIANDLPVVACRLGHFLLVRVEHARVEAVDKSVEFGLFENILQGQFRSEKHVEQLTIMPSSNASSADDQYFSSLDS